MPKKRYSAEDIIHKLRELIGVLADVDSFTELTAAFGASIITGFLRVEGAPLAVMANDCRVFGGAINADSAKKATRFMRLCEAFDLPLVTLVDTPGFIVGPDSERQGGRGGHSPRDGCRDRSGQHA